MADVFVSDSSGIVHLVVDHEPGPREGRYLAVCGAVIGEHRPLTDTLTGLLCRRCAEGRRS